jgi:hypothetical protein
MYWPIGFWQFASLKKSRSRGAAKVVARRQRKTKKSGSRIDSMLFNIKSSSQRTIQKCDRKNSYLTARLKNLVMTSKSGNLIAFALKFRVQ